MLIQLQQILSRFNCELNEPSASPPSPPVSAAAGRHHIFSSGQTEASQVQEVFDHLTFDGNIQGCVGVEAVEIQTSETPSAFMRTGVCVGVCVSLTLVICWPPGSRVLDSHPAWCQSRTARGSCTETRHLSSSDWAHTVLTWRRKKTFKDHSKHLKNAQRMLLLETYAMMVLTTMSFIFSQIRVVLTPLEPRYSHKAFKALKKQNTQRLLILWRLARCQRSWMGRTILEFHKINPQKYYHCLSTWDRSCHMLTIKETLWVKGHNN